MPVEHGRWEPTAAWRDTQRGRLRTGSGAGRTFEIRAGEIGTGEWVAVRAAETPQRPACGPVAAPAFGFPPREPMQELLPDEVVRLAPGSRGARVELEASLGALREGGLERLGAQLDPRTAGLLGALLFGDRAGLAAHEADLFVRTGTRHLLAVSGLHVGLVCLLLIWPAGALAARGLALALAHRRRGAGSSVGPCERLLATPTLWRALLLALFVPLAGQGAPVVRAAWALALALLIPRRCYGSGPDGAAGRRPTAADYRNPDGLSVWGFALCLEVLRDPLALFDLSLQLSYTATLGLLLGTQPMARRLASCFGSCRAGRERRPLGGPARAPAVLAGRLGRGLRAATAASAAALLATLPLVWSHFGEFSPLGILATPLTLPLLAWLLCAGWIWICVPLCVPAVLLELPADALFGLLELFDGLPASPSPLPPRPLLLVGALCGLSFAALRASRWGAHLRRMAALGWAITLLPWSALPSCLEVWALDVGAGTALVLRAPGAGTWVFDAGSRDRPGVARAALAPLLRHWDTARLSVVLSHDHRDHHSGLPWLIERYPIRLWAGALPARCAVRLAHDTPTLDCGPGRARLLSQAPGRPLTITLLRGVEGPGNEGSRSLAVSYRGDRLLFCGDAEARGLAALLREGDLPAPLRLLLLPHHGSQTPLLGPLLRDTRPSEVWISAGDRQGVGAELDRRGLVWGWTARDGPLGLVLGGRSRTPALFTRGPRESPAHGTNPAAERPTAGW